MKKEIIKKIMEEINKDFPVEDFHVYSGSEIKAQLRGGSTFKYNIPLFIHIPHQIKTKYNLSTSPFHDRNIFKLFTESLKKAILLTEKYLAQHKKLNERTNELKEI